MLGDITEIFSIIQHDAGKILFGYLKYIFLQGQAD